MSDITNGKTVCRFPIDATAGVRTFGGRQWGTRPCTPEECKAYQAGECKFGGMIQFYIPGVKGAGIWVLPTTSWYSMVAIKSVIENVAAITGGRVARLFNEDGESVFVLTKTEETVASVDWKTGKPVQRTQYLVYLDLNIDMTELALMHDRKSIAARATVAAEKLNGGNGGVVKVVEATHEVVETKVVEAQPAKKEAAKEASAGAKAEPKASNGAKKTLLKECVALKNALPEETYKEIRAKYPEDSAAWTMEETEGFHTALKAAAVKPAESTPEAVAEEKISDNGALTDDLLAEICEKAAEFGIENELCRKVTTVHANTEAVARNWLARLAQGDFTMYLEALK